MQAHWDQRPAAARARGHEGNHRQYHRWEVFTVGTDLRGVTPEELGLVADEINHRPRKTLAWARPADLPAGEIAAETA